jgi:hypothetical protein
LLSLPFCALSLRCRATHKDSTRKKILNCLNLCGLSLAFPRIFLSRAQQLDSFLMPSWRKDERELKHKNKKQENKK